MQRRLFGLQANRGRSGTRSCHPAVESMETRTLLSTGTLPGSGSSSALAPGAVASLVGVTTMGSLTHAPTITSPATRAFPLGVSTTFTVTATGSPTPAMSETGTLPKGITFVDNHDGTATISGSADALPGTYSLVITAANGVSPDATQNFNLSRRRRGPGTHDPQRRSCELHGGVGGELRRDGHRGPDPCAE